MLLPGQTIPVCTDMKRLMSELLVVAEDLIDDLLRAADQSRAARDRVLKCVEDWLDPALAHPGQTGFKDWAVGCDSFLRGPGRVVTSGAGADQTVCRGVTVRGPAFAVVADQSG